MTQPPHFSSDLQTLAYFVSNPFHAVNHDCDYLRTSLSVLHIPENWQYIIVQMTNIKLSVIALKIFQVCF